jgi:6-phosphogluconolactonase
MSQKAHVLVFPDLDALSYATAERLMAVMQKTLEERGRCTMALSGGSTPRRLYELLAGPYRDRIDWAHTYLFWGDERFVPPNNPESNYRMAREAMVDHVPIPPDHVFPIPTDTTSPEQAAQTYAATLHSFFSDDQPAFDVMLLGIGEDGHTASLFPENHPKNALQQSEAVPWVEAVKAPPRYATTERITMTLSFINRSRHIFIQAAGAKKHDALRTILDDPDTTLPAAYVRARDELVWFVDEAAYIKFD